MRKHIFGFALFSLIFAAFALVYAFFYAPSIPPIEAVKPPISQAEMRTEKPYSCQFRRNKVSYRVQSSELNVEKNKFISKMTIYWNGNDNPPKEIIVEPKIFTLENVEKTTENSKALTKKVLVEPFKNKAEATFLIESDITGENLILGNKNIYVIFNIIDGENGKYLTGIAPSFDDTYQVLLTNNEKNLKFLQKLKNLK